jgi:glycerophosphoryl diester phosphodiesterase
MSEMEIYQPVLETAPEVTNPGRFRRVAAAGALFLAGVSAGLSPSSADAAEQSQMYQACHTMTVLDHRGAVGPIDRIGPNENTLEAMEATYEAGGVWVETDMQLTRDNQVVDLHDARLEDKTDGTGKVSLRPGRYISGLQTPAGSKVPFLVDMIGFMEDHPSMYGQWEFKTYKDWAPKVLKSTVNAVADAGLEDRIHFTSGSLNLLKRIRDINPNFELNWIGFDTRPNLHEAAVAGIPQVNVTYEQGFGAYHGYKSYIGAARHQKVAGTGKPLQVSIRSHADGVGDNGQVWSKGIKLHASQFVVQDHNKYRRWCNSQ